MCEPPADSLPSSRFANVRCGVASEAWPSNFPGETSSASCTHGVSGPSRVAPCLSTRMSVPKSGRACRTGRELPLFQPKCTTSPRLSRRGIERPMRHPPQPKPQRSATERDRTANDVGNDDEVQYPANEAGRTSGRTHRTWRRKRARDCQRRLAPPPVNTSPHHASSPAFRLVSGPRKRGLVHVACADSVARSKRRCIDMEPSGEPVGDPVSTTLNIHTG